MLRGTLARDLLLGWERVLVADRVSHLDRVLLLCAFFGLLAVFALVNPAGAANAPITFSVIGDIPYGSSEIEVLEDIVADHNIYAPADFFVHVGDIKSGSESCSETRYATVADILRDLAVPAFILPGDNEWNDCSNPSQAWGYWTKHLLGLEQDFCGVPGDFQGQSVRPENFAFTWNGVLFIGLNIVGGSVLSNSERNTRLQQDADWVEQKLAQYGSTVRAMVVFGHAGPSSGRARFFDQFRSDAGSWGKPVLYAHGDGHSWILDRPFSQQNILRLQVPAGDDGFVQVLVSLDATNPFNLTQDPWPWPKRTPAFNKPPCVEAEAESPIAFGDAAGIGGFVTDDGDPDPPEEVTTFWSQVAGPAGVAIANPGAPSTTATFPDAGTYVLRLTASDGALQTTEDVSIDVVGLVIDDVFVSESESAVFTVSLLAAQGDPVTVGYTTSNGTAVAPGDYSARSGTLSFSGTTTTRTIQVPVLADVSIEGTESFLVNLTNSSGAPLAKAQGVAIVLDPDATLPPVLSSFTPTSGPVGSEVTLTGGRFSGATEVRFGGIPAAGFAVDSDARIRAAVPASDATGPISVTTPNGSDMSAESFVARLPVLDVDVSGAGAVALSPPGGSHALGSVVTLTALPAPGYDFAGWDGALSGSASPTTITMDGDRFVTASFTAFPPGSVSLDVVLEGLGTVTTDPVGRVQPLDTSVTLTATPAPGYGFAGWSGDLAGSTNPASLLLNGDRLVTATFVEQLACSNGLDDDADGGVDFPADPGCRDALSSTESPQCDDAIDNDGDGTVDWDGGPSGGTADATCSGRGWGSREKTLACGLGFELALLLPLLAGLHGRRRAPHTRAG